MPDAPAPIALIGARAEKLKRLDPEWLALYRRIAIAAAHAGRTVHTGAATGADQIAAEAALEAGGRVVLFLPDAGLEASWRAQTRSRYPGQVEEIIYSPVLHPEWEPLVREVHPNYKALRPFDLCLMCRNVGLQLGPPCVAGVVALPLWEHGRAGGTEFGLRLARHLGIKVWDLSERTAREEWGRRLG